MSTMASQTTGDSSVYSTVCSDAGRRKHQSSALLAFVREIHRWPVNSPHKGPATRKMFPFDDVIMQLFVLFGKSPAPTLVPKLIFGQRGSFVRHVMAYFSAPSTGYVGSVMLKTLRGIWVADRLPTAFRTNSTKMPLLFFYNTLRLSHIGAYLETISSN